MHQTEATNIILKLLPDFERTDPGDVLLKYAKEHSLAPAQLEKLGCSFNTMSVLLQQENDREKVPPLLDVTGLTREYVDNYKAASSRSIFDPEPEEQELEKAASTPEVDARHLMNWTERPQVFEAQGPRPVQKKAADEWRETSTLLAEVRDVCRGLHETWGAACGRTGALVEKIAGSPEPDLTFGTLVRDAHQHGVEGVDQFEKVLKAACADREIPFRPEIVVSDPVLVRDHTGLLDHFKEALSKCAALHKARETIYLGLEKIAEGNHKYAGDYFAQNQIRKTANEVEKIASLLDPLGKQSSAARQRDAGEDADRAYEEAMRDFDEGRKWDGATGIMSSTALRGVDATHKIPRTLFREIPGMWSEFAPGGQTAKYLDELVGEKNRRKVKDDELDLKRVESDTRSIAILQKLMLTDEILSKKDPEKVFEAFQSIRRASPEVASDTSLLRLMLRQALETQGVDIDTASAGRKYEFGQHRTSGNPTWDSSLTPSST